MNKLNVKSSPTQSDFSLARQADSVIEVAPRPIKQLNLDRVAELVLSTITSELTTHLSLTNHCN